LFCETVGLPAPSSAIVPVVLGDADRALAASQMLGAEGFLVRAIRPPTVPEGTARLRVTFTANQREDDVVRLAHAVRSRLPRRGDLIA
jgi:8-amino-7-oxononanoate synthase